ncbi:class I SAM-dependent methyltransferase [Micromonospora chersina]|uniref:class I SAM-dependent methyltransferase n=1 Tax=Micromonospora chersina TaxID=47854 RepID=UPI0033CE6D74
MQDMIKRVDRCRVCGRDDWLDVLSLGSTPLANGLLEPAAEYNEPAYPVEVVVCRDCRLMSLRHVVNPEALFGHYVYVSSDSASIRNQMRRIVGWCTEKVGLTEGDLVVEMGSNIGTQLLMFQEAGFRTVGVDPARNLTRIANERGVETVADFFGPDVTAPLARQHGEAMLVLGRQCFAHIDDVHNILKGVDTVLAPEGALVIEVPYLVDLLDDNQFDTIYHEHLSYFSVGTLQRLFALHGLRLIDVERADVHGGSVIVFAARNTGSRQPAPAVAEILALEAARELQTDEPYLRLAERARHVTTEVHRIVRDLVAAGKRVACYGAPSKGNALLMAAGLTSSEIEFCSDTTTLKQGKVLPGSHIPVCSPEEAADRHPDYYLLLAWNYADEIVAKEREFLERGGKFIVPIPEPRVVSAHSGAEGLRGGAGR